MRKKIYKITITAESIFDKSTLSNLIIKELKNMRGTTLEESPMYISIEEAEKIE